MKKTTVTQAETFLERTFPTHSECFLQTIATEGKKLKFNRTYAVEEKGCKIKTFHLHKISTLKICDIL